MRTISAIILVSIFAVLVCSCGRRSVVIPDVTAGFSTNLTTTVTYKHVDTIGLHVRGQLDGTGYIFSASWPTQALSGVVDWRIGHDWFETNCVIQYAPGRVKSGNLTIDYWF